MKKPPRYPKKAHHSGQARVFWRGKDHYLGLFGSPESWAAYTKLVDEWREAANQQDAPPPQKSPQFAVRTVEDLIAHFWPYAQTHYRRADGTQTPEVKAYQQTLRVLRAVHGQTPIRDFGPVALKQVRQAMIDGSWLTPEDRARLKKRKQPPGWCRTQVNHRVGRLKRVWKWAVGEELIPVELYERLRAVAGLQAGRSGARERPPVVPVADSVVDRTLPHLGSVVRAMVQLQRLTGMRPGEVCRLRSEEIDRAGPKVGEVQTWVYCPAQHKTAHRGFTRAVVIGPKAQRVLTPFLSNGHCFKPSDATAEFHRSRSRQTPAYPSHVRTLARRKAQRRRVNFAQHYTVSAYYKAVVAACGRAGVERWTPNRLRHTAATEIAVRFGLDAARATLGHADAGVTTRYAERSLHQAAEVAAQIG